MFFYRGRVNIPEFFYVGNRKEKHPGACCCTTITNGGREAWDVSKIVGIGKLQICLKNRISLKTEGPRKINGI